MVTVGRVLDGSRDGTRGVTTISFQMECRRHLLPSVGQESNRAPTGVTSRAQEHRALRRQTLPLQLLADCWTWTLTSLRLPLLLLSRLLRLHLRLLAKLRKKCSRWSLRLDIPRSMIFVILRAQPLSRVPIRRQCLCSPWRCRWECSPVSRDSRCRRCLC